MQSEHFAEVVALQASCFPPPFPAELLWQNHHLARHLEIFPEGQFVALADGQVIASASSLRVTQKMWDDHGCWDDLTGGLELRNHAPDGSILYGADISVHPAWRGQGIGKALYQARYDLVRRQQLEAYATACRIPDFQGSGLDVMSYVAAILSGRLVDRTLSPLVRMGLQVVGIQENVMDDPESGNAAVRLEWRP